MYTLTFPGFGPINTPSAVESAHLQLMGWQLIATPADPLPPTLPPGAAPAPTATPRPPRPVPPGVSPGAFNALGATSVGSGPILPGAVSVPVIPPGGSIPLEGGVMAPPPVILQPPYNQYTSGQLLTMLANGQISLPTYLNAVSGVVQLQASPYQHPLPPNMATPALPGPGVSLTVPQMMQAAGFGLEFPPGGTVVVYGLGNQPASITLANGVVISQPRPGVVTLGQGPPLVGPGSLPPLPPPGASPRPGSSPAVPSWLASALLSSTTPSPSQIAAAMASGAIPAELAAYNIAVAAMGNTAQPTNMTVRPGGIMVVTFANGAQVQVNLATQSHTIIQPPASAGPAARPPGTTAQPRPPTQPVPLGPLGPLGLPTLAPCLMVPPPLPPALANQLPRPPTGPGQQSPAGVALFQLAGGVAGGPAGLLAIFGPVAIQQLIGPPGMTAGQLQLASQLIPGVDGAPAQMPALTVPPAGVAVRPPNMGFGPAAQVGALGTGMSLQDQLQFAQQAIQFFSTPPASSAVYTYANGSHINCGTYWFLMQGIVQGLIDAQPLSPQPFNPGHGALGSGGPYAPGVVPPPDPPAFNPVRGALQTGGPCQTPCATVKPPPDDDDDDECKDAPDCGIQDHPDPPPDQNCPTCGGGHAVLGDSLFLTYETVEMIGGGGFVVPPPPPTLPLTIPVVWDGVNHWVSDCYGNPQTGYFRMSFACPEQAHFIPPCPSDDWCVDGNAGVTLGCHPLHVAFPTINEPTGTAADCSISPFSNFTCVFVNAVLSD